MTISLRSVAVAALAPLLVLGACSSGATPVASDQGSNAPRQVPAADGPVRTANLATVIDSGGGPVELCLGPVAESYPPQCSGPAIPNWDWDTHGGGGFEEASGVRWGLYSLTGEWNGTEFTVSDTVIAALYDSFYEEPPAPPAPARTYSSEELNSYAIEVGDLPGAQGAYADESHVYLDVTYDDGSIQSYLDQTYGENVVLVTSALVDAG